MNNEKLPEWTLVVNKKQKSLTTTKVPQPKDSNYEKITIKRDGRTKTY